MMLRLQSLDYKCTSCGAPSLKFGEGRRRAVCGYCGTEYFLSEDNSEIPALDLKKKVTNKFEEQDEIQLYYDLSEDGLYAVVSACDDDINCAVIASKYKEKAVKKIDICAFSCCTKLESVTIPDSVTDIEICAFSGCESLTSLVIPDSVINIASSAFEDCTNLESVRIGKGVVNIDPSAFSGCEKLYNIEVDSQNPNYKSIDGHLYTKDGKTLVQCAIGQYWESSGELVYKISDDGMHAILVDCEEDAENVVIAPSYAGKPVKVIASNAFVCCKKLVSVTIPYGITYIGSRAFGSCKSLTDITLPDSVTIIGESAFSLCEKLSKVTLGKSIVSIGDSAFYDCTELTDVTIPDSTETIGKGAFSSCRNLSRLILGKNLVSIGDSAFSDCSSLADVIIPELTETIGKKAFSGCTKLSKLLLRSSLTSIGDMAFFGDDNLTDIIGTPEQLKAIKDVSFIDLPSQDEGVQNRVDKFKKRLQSLGPKY